MATTSNCEAVKVLRLIFLLEIEFQRRARSAALRLEELPELHASFAIQHGYERRLHEARGVTALDLETLSRELTSAAAPEDVLRAADLLRRILDL